MNQPSHTLYGTNGSGSAVVELALQHANLPYTVVRASQWEPDSAMDALEKVNPLKQIPTLVLPDGTVLTESAAILIHLGLTCPQAGLLPADPSRRAENLRGLVFIAANCYAAVSVSDFPERWFVTPDAAPPSEAEKKAVRQGARRNLHRAWEIFADAFPARPFFNGETPGALDYLALVVSQWSGSRAHIRTHRPDFMATLERIEAIPAVAQVMARHRPLPPPAPPASAG